nr:DUF4913 domain-containing protein [Microbacterium paludicola]
MRSPALRRSRSSSTSDTSPARSCPNGNRASCSALTLPTSPTLSPRRLFAPWCRRPSRTRLKTRWRPRSTRPWTPPPSRNCRRRRPRPPVALSPRRWTRSTRNQPTLYYGSVDEFVREYLVKNYRRRVDGQRTVWAADWWNYPEATIRLDALWRAWEHLRLAPTTGMSVWFRDHADHHMSVLLDPSGPFAAADEGRNRENVNEKGGELPYAPPPEGLYPDLRKDAASPTADA